MKVKRRKKRKEHNRIKQDRRAEKTRRNKMRRQVIEQDNHKQDEKIERKKKKEEKDIVAADVHVNNNFSPHQIDQNKEEYKSTMQNTEKNWTVAKEEMNREKTMFLLLLFLMLLLIIIAILVKQIRTRRNIKNTILNTEESQIMAKKKCYCY